jgi:hypothetical protein
LFKNWKRRQLDRLRERLLSYEICIIDYFFIARNWLLMLYLRRSQINVPRDRRQGNSSRPSMLQCAFVEIFRKEAFFEEAQNCKANFI